MDFSAVLFDFDGVLVDTEWAIYQSWRRVFEAHSHDLPLEIYTRCIGSDFATWSPKTHLEDLTGLAFDWHDLDARRQEEIMAELNGAGPMQGARELLDKLPAAELPEGIGYEWSGLSYEEKNAGAQAPRALCHLAVAGFPQPGRAL